MRNKFTYETFLELCQNANHPRAEEQARDMWEQFKKDVIAELTKEN